MAEIFLIIYLFGVLCHFQNCTGHITTGSRGNQYIESVRVVYCKLPTNGKQLPAFPLDAVTGMEPRPQRWEASVLPLCHHGSERFFYRNQCCSNCISNFIYYFLIYLCRGGICFIVMYLVVFVWILMKC